MEPAELPDAAAVQLFGSSDDFQEWFGCAPGLAGSGTAEALLNEEEVLLVTNRLHQVLRPFILRRLKESVATDLPKKARMPSPWCPLHAWSLSSSYDSRNRDTTQSGLMKGITDFH